MLNIKIGPWNAAVFCAVLSVITLVANLAMRFATGVTDAGLTALICFLPMCFFFVGSYLAQLRDENDQLRQRVDELQSILKNDRSAA